MARLQRLLRQFFLRLPGLPMLLLHAAARRRKPIRRRRLLSSWAWARGRNPSRLIGERLSERLGQAVNLENRAGVNATAEAILRAPANGYTLLLAHAANAINATLYDQLNFNLMRDIAPVAGLVQVPLVIVVNPSFPPATIPQLIAYARANPGKVGMGLPAGTPIVLAAGLFTMTTGLELAHVPYPGDSPAIKELIAGKVQMQFAGLAAAKGHFASGQLRALAVTSATRVQVLPEIPTLGEFSRGYELMSWFGIGAPRNARSEILLRSEKEMTAILSDPAVQERIIDWGHVPAAMPRAAFQNSLLSKRRNSASL